ncbi:MAG: aminoacyl-tRNA hydrolase, partial [Propionibacteriaceae bacterium]|jgi:PTH1 family peptidyl-tRNA hydrolase|nr:aminoacyl-tRNA hydrolase [Propionibacteriaceae bacterium]
LLKANTADIQVSPGGVGVPSPQIQRVVLATTRTYMNESGVPVRNLLGNLKTRPDHLVVIHDELDLDVGRMRVKFGGGDNGHNGLKSIRAMNGGGDYFRVRLGIGRPPGRQEVTDWVLTNFSASEKDTVAQMVMRGADAVESLIVQGLDATQSHFNN